MAERVLIVDDSALMRKRLGEIIAGAGYETATARDGADCLRQLETFRPDAITLDIHMPEMNGLECLARIMIERPTPVLMVSSLTSENAEATLEAFELGAVDVVQKPGGTISLNIKEIDEELLEKLAAAMKARTPSGGVARRRRARKPAERPRRAAASVAPQKDFPIVLVGVSTGGPRVVEAMIADLDPDLPAAVVIAQHMPGAFTSTFARRLNEAAPLPICELSTRVQLAPGQVYVCRGDADAVLRVRDGAAIGQSVPIDRGFTWHPSVERLVRSALDVIAPERLIGVMLTGMGDDGAAAMTTLKQRGGWTIAESEETALVYGMPRALIEAGGAAEALPADAIAERLNDLVLTPAAKRRA